jgi:hypothetical protein
MAFVFSCGEVPEWPKGADCKSAGVAFGGSNPPLSTKYGLKEEIGAHLARAGIAQLVEREPSKLGVAGSSPVSRSKSDFGCCSNAHVAQSVEHFLGKEEVTGSNPVVGFGN